MIIDIDVFDLGVSESFIAGHVFKSWQREQMLLSHDETQVLWQKQRSIWILTLILLYWAIYCLMSRAITGRNMLSTTCESTLSLSLQPCTEYSNCSQVIWQWGTITDSCFKPNIPPKSLYLGYKHLGFAMQFYTQQHRVILGVTASVIPRDTLFIRSLLIMKLITHYVEQDAFWGKRGIEQMSYLAIDYTD